MKKAQYLLSVGIFAAQCFIMSPQNSFASIDDGKSTSERKSGAIPSIQTAPIIDQSKKDQLFFKANGQVNAFDYAGSIITFSQIIETYPRDPEAYSSRGYSEYCLKKYVDALQDCSKAIEIDPKYINAYFVRGMAKDMLKNLKGALDDFSKVIEIDPKNSMAYYDRGNARKDMGDTLGAIVDFTKAIELNPKYAYAYCNRGYMKKNNDALNDYQKAVELEPNNLLFVLNLAKGHINAKEYLLAIGECDNVLHREPNNYDGFFYKGIAKYKKGDLKGALADFLNQNKFDTQKENIYASYDIMGYCLLVLDKNDLAIEYFETCLKMKNSDADVFLGLAVAYYQKNDIAKAGEYLLKIQKILPLFTNDMAGIELFERNGGNYTDREKELFKKMFEELE